MVGAAPAKRPRLLDQRLQSRLLVLWVVAFIIAGVVKHKLMPGGALDLDASLLNRFSVLEVIGAAYVIRLAARLPSSNTVPAGVALATIGIIATLVLLLRYRPGYASGGLELWLLALSIRIPHLRTVALAATLFVFQYLFFTGPFLWLHEAIGQVDAAVVRSALQELGYDVTGFGPIIVSPDGVHGVNVMGACSTSQVLGTVGIGFALIVLGRRGRFASSDWTWGGALVAAAMVVNWVRLAPMALTREGHAYWHDGDGAALVALAYGAVTVAAAFAATRDAGHAGGVSR